MMSRVDLDADRTVGAALRALGLQTGRSVLVVAGSAAEFDEHQSDRVRLLFEQVVAPVCRTTPTTVIYGGTRVGVMSLLGEAMADHAPGCVLLGVAPKRLVPFGSEPRSGDQEAPDPHHTHFLRTDGDSWGEESVALVRIAECIASKDNIVVLAISGGDGTVRELDLAAARGWPVLLVTECGGKVDEVDADLRASSKKHVSAFPHLQAANIKGLLSSIPIGDRGAIHRVLVWRLSDASVLRQAWLRFLAIDARASTDKPIDFRTKFLVLGLGVLATLAAILAAYVSVGPWHLAMLGVATAAPLAASLLLLTQARHLRGSHWVPYRSAAEAIRREIYRYRTQAGVYSDVAPGRREQCLANALATIDQGVGGRSAILVASLGGEVWPPPQLGPGTVHPEDALLNDLDGDGYATFRVRHQLDYYSRRLYAADRLVARILPIAFLATTIATIFGALGFSFDQLGIWVALASSIGAGVLAWLNYDQTEQRARSMASGASAVRSAYERWLALPVSQRSGAVAELASDVEDSLGAEAADWNRVLRQAQRSFHSE